MSQKMANSFERTLMDQEIDDQDNFKLLFKCMKAWKAFHKHQKQRKAEKNKFLKLMMTAIEKYEYNLLIKSYRGI